MRVSTAALAMFIALIGPAVAVAPSPRAAHKKAARFRTVAEKPSDLLPVPALQPPLPDRGAIGGDKSLHFGNVTVTSGGFLDVRRGSASGRN